MYEFLEYFAPIVLIAFLILDLAWGARWFETPRFWRLRAFLMSVVAFVVSMAVTLGWGLVFDGFALLPGERLGTWLGALIGILVYELGHYWYHRAVHEIGWLWRWVHQMHHSAESLDAFGAYYLSPLDVVGFSTVASLVFFPLLGLSMEAGLIAGAFLAFNAVFQHANIRTPHWLGYFIQRPESHGIHHGRGVHRYNYSDLPLWDMVFGTFRNPRNWDGEVGFYVGASTRVGDMLLGRDVSEPPPGDRDRQNKQERLREALEVFP